VANPTEPACISLSIRRPPCSVRRTLQAAVFDPGATFLSHISLALPDEAAGLALRERLTRHGVETTPIMDQGPIRNMGFIDNNGMSLEAEWPRGPVQIT
jgi:hypothetical protein